MKGWTIHKKRFYSLLAVLVILLIASYLFSFSKAINTWREYDRLLGEAGKSSALQRELVHYQRLNAKIDQNLAGVDVLSGFHENLLATTGLFCEEHSLILAEFSEPFQGIDGSYKVETIILTIKGDFVSQVKLIHHLEKNFKSGGLASVKFEKAKNFRTNKEELFLKLYVQKLMRHENES